MRALNILAIAGVILASPQVEAKEKISKQVERLWVMTAQDFAQSVSLKDDSFEISATLDTANGWKETHGLLKIVWDDVFLRAFINKKTGETTFQIYQKFLYSGSGWRHYEQANYHQSNGELTSTSLDRIGTNVDCSLSQYQGCTYTEIVGFTVTEADLRRISSLYDPAKRNAWGIRYKSQAGADFNTGITAAEVAGILLAVDKYRAERLPQSKQP